MAKSRGGVGPSPDQDPSLINPEAGGAAASEEEALKQMVRGQSDYQQLVGRFESLRTPQKGDIGSQAEFIQALKEAVPQWGSGPKKDAAELFISDYESRAHGASVRKGKKEGRRSSAREDVRALAREDAAVDEGSSEKRSKKTRSRGTLAEQLTGVAVQTRAEEIPPAPQEASRVVENLGPSAEAPTVEKVAEAVLDAQQEAQESGEPITLEKYRQLFMDWFPRLAVRQGHQDKDTQKWSSNLDGNACLFMFRDIFGFASGTEAEKRYVEEDVEYVKPGTYKKGALNLDTSPGLHGIQFEDETFFIDHHGSESERHSSAFQILHEEFKRAGLEKQLTPENRVALERLAKFVTHVDSYTLPSGLHWSDAWNSSHRTVFGLTLAYQNNVPIEALFEFFKHHDLKAAWTLAVDESKDPYLAKFRELSARWLKDKEGTEKFVREVKQRPNPMGFVAETKELGRIFVQTQRRPSEKKAALQFAALAQGFDGVLVWEPDSGVFFLASGPAHEVTPELMEKIGEGILVRRSLVKKMGKDRRNSLGSLLITLGVNAEKLPPDIRKQVEAVANPEVAVSGDAGREFSALGGEKSPEDKRAEFKKNLLERLILDKGVLPEVLFKSPDSLRNLVENWDLFLQAVDEYEKSVGESSQAREKTSELVRLILEAHPDLAQEEVFKTWLEKFNEQPAATSPAGTEHSKGADREAELSEHRQRFLVTLLEDGKGEIPMGALSRERVMDWIEHWEDFEASVKKYEGTHGKSQAYLSLYNATYFLRKRIDEGIEVSSEVKKVLSILEERLGFKPSEPIPSVEKVEQPPQVLETVGGKFKPGDTVKMKKVEGVKGFVGLRTVEGFVYLGGGKDKTRYYKLAGESGRMYQEAWLEKITPPVEPAPVPEAPSVVSGPEAPIPSEAPMLERLEGGVEAAGGTPAAAETPIAETPVEPARELYDTTRLKELGEGGEDPEIVRVRMDEKRQAYIDLYKEYLAAKVGTGRFDKLKKKLWPFGKKKGEAGPVVPPEVVLELKAKIEAAREEYLQAKKEYARALFQAKARDLAEAGLTVEEITAELNKFGHEIFKKLMIGEDAALQAAKAAEWPAKERNILRQGLDWWVKQHWTVKTLMTTGILTGALFAGGYIGIGAVGGYALSRLVRSGTGAIFGQGVGKAVDWIMGRRIRKFVDTNLQDAMIEFREAGGSPQDVIDRIWERQNRIFEQKKKKEKHKLYAKIGATIAAGIGAAQGLSMLMASSAEATEQAAAAAAKEAAEHGGALPEPTLEELQKRLQDIMDQADKDHRSFMEMLRVKAEAAAVQARLDDLSTIHKGEGVIHVFRRQLEAMPGRFGYTGNLDDAAAVHEWADRQATQLSIKAGYWNPTTGDQNWVRWDPQHPMRFQVEGDAQHGFKVTETGTEGRHFIHHPTEAEQMRINEARAKLPWREFDEAWDKETAARVAARAAAKPLEISPEASRILSGVGRAVDQVTVDSDSLPEIQPGQRTVETVTGLKGVRVAETAPAAADFPEPVRPYASYLESKLLAAQSLVDQYGNDPKLGPAVHGVMEKVQEDVAAFVTNVDAGRLSAYQGFSPKGVDVSGELRDAIERQVGVKIPVAEPISAGKGLSMAELLKGGRIDVDKTWGLKFETSAGGRVMPVIDAPRADMSRVFEYHAGMKTDGWLQSESVPLLAEVNRNLAAVPQTRLAQIDFLVRALDKIQTSGQGATEAAGVVRRSIRVMMENISQTIDRPVEEVFTRQFLDRVK